MQTEFNTNKTLETINKEQGNELIIVINCCSYLVQQNWLLPCSLGVCKKLQSSKSWLGNKETHCGWSQKISQIHCEFKGSYGWNLIKTTSLTLCCGLTMTLQSHIHQQNFHQIPPMNKTALKQSLPSGLINSNYEQFESPIQTCVWNHDKSVVYNIPSLTSFKCVVSINTCTLIIKDNLPTLEEFTSLVEGFLIVIHFDIIVSQILQNGLLNVSLPTNDQSHIWGQYVLTMKEEKYYFQFAYHTVKAAPH